MAKYRKSTLSNRTSITTIMIASLFALALYIANYSIKQAQIFQSEASGSGINYYVSKTGSNSNSGTLESPFATIDYGWRHLQAGDTLYIMGGTYAEKVQPATNGTATSPITITSYNNEKVIIDGTNTIERPLELIGSYTIVKNIEVTNSKWACVVVGGNHNTVDNLIAHNCYSHGIYTENSDINILNNTVYDTNSMNSARTLSSGWGSAIKLKVGSNNVLVQGNTVYHNYGEGVAATRATNSIIKNNYLYDNYYANIYVDNSYSIKVESNFSSCTNNTTYNKVVRDSNGNITSYKKPAAIALAEEYYSGWGNKLNAIEVTQNVGAFCGNGLAYWGADSGAGGLRNVNVHNNTFYGGNRSVISIEAESGTINTNISNNIFHSPTVAPWIANSTGISLHDNFWIGTLPSTSTLSRGANDIAGTINFALAPVYNDINSFKIVGSNPSFTTGYYGVTSFYSKLVNTVTPSPSTLPTISPVPTPIPTSTPTSTPTPTPTSLPTTTPIPTMNTAPVIETNSLLEGAINSDYKSPLIVSDSNTTDTLSAKIVGLPKGLSLNSCTQAIVSNKKQLSCRISGKTKLRGTFSPTITANDNAGHSVTHTYTLIIK